MIGQDDSTLLHLVIGSAVDEPLPTFDTFLRILDKSPSIINITSLEVCV